MTAATKATIKSYFQTGDKPTQSNFTDFIDSCLFPADTTSTQIVSANVNFVGRTQVSGNTLTPIAYTSAGSSQLVGASSSGVMGAITLGTGLSISGTTLSNSVTSKINNYQVTDTTNVALSQFSTQTNIGSAVSANIPTKGHILMLFSGDINYATSTSDAFYLGIRIGSTNYWPKWTSNSINFLSQKPSTTGGETLFASGVTGDSGNAGVWPIFLPIEILAIPTGAQSVQVIGAKSTSNTVTVRGATTTTRVNLMMFDCS